MMTNKSSPDHTAIRVALWRALHLEVDSPPHVFEDDIGVKLVGDDRWRDRPDMEVGFSKSMRASIVGRARFIEDLVLEKVGEGVSQYVILGAGLDTFAQRNPEIISKINVFEIDKPSTQEWKKIRLKELGFSIPENLNFVPVDFEIGESWREKLLNSTFDLNKRTIVVSTGVSMYLSLEANLSTFKQLASLASGSIFATTFMLSLELLGEKERGIMEFVINKAREANTPFLSLFKPEEILEHAKTSGFKDSKYVSANDIYNKYFRDRNDGLNAGNAEAFLVAYT
ncbi:MAG: class I SAM-dependent methyltransferase [Leptospiraceae bacterium]|nr:class I SAM-dependent methyltransferase [Leptospiraceae bacterium]